MFGFRKADLPLHRYAEEPAATADRGGYFVERLADGARLFDGRAFASGLAAYMALGTLAPSERRRIVDARGQVLFVSRGGDALDELAAEDRLSLAA